MTDTVNVPREKLEELATKLRSQAYCSEANLIGGGGNANLARITISHFTSIASLVDAMLAAAPKVEQEMNLYQRSDAMLYGAPKKIHTRPAPASDELLEALEAIKSLDGEINENNYTHDDVCELNNAFVEAWNIADRAIAKHKGPQS